MVSQSNFSSPAHSPSSYKGSKVGFISPQASNIYRYTQMANTPKMRNGLDIDENSNNYFNRVRKQSAGSTPFSIYDATSTSTDKKSTLDSPSAPSRKADGSSTPFKFGEALVPLQSPASSTRPPRQTKRFSLAFNYSKTSTSFHRGSGRSGQRGGYLLDDDAAPAPLFSSTHARGQLGRLDRTRGASVNGTSLPLSSPAKEVTQLSETKAISEPSLTTVRELEAMLQAQSQEISALKQNHSLQSHVLSELKQENKELSSRLESLEDQGETSKSKNHPKKMGFQSPTTSTHRMILRRRKNQN